MLTVRYAPVRALSELIPEAEERLSPELCRYATLPRGEGDRARRLAGLLLLSSVYSEEVGQRLPPILRTPEGKPYFAEGGYHFSISHADGMVAVALSDTEVGIDIELLCEHKRERIERLSRWMGDGERAAIAAAESADRAFVTAWVRKEAQVKKSGIGLAGMRSADATLPPLYEATPRGEYYLAVY